MTRLPERNLDILRAIAVLCVVVTHLDDAMGWLHTRFDWFALGRFGVLLFFVHTALVLMGSLERLEAKGDAGWTLARTFYVRRAFRIYPLAMAVVILAVAFSIPMWIVHGKHIPPVPPTPPTVLENLALVQDLFQTPNIQAVLWSLPLEVQMYVLLPLCFAVARRSWRWMVGLVAAFVLVGVFLPSIPIPGVWRLDVFKFGPCFLGGVLAYHLLRRTTPRLPAWAWLGAFVVAAAIFLRSAPDLYHPERGWLACLVLGGLIPWFKDAPSNVVTDGAKTVAKYSYGIYLTHSPAIWIAFVLGAHLPRVVQWGDFLTLFVALSWVAYHAIEAPGIRLGQRLTHRIVPQFLEVGAP